MQGSWGPSVNSYHVVERPVIHLPGLELGGGQKATSKTVALGFAEPPGGDVPHADSHACSPALFPSFLLWYPGIEHREVQASNTTHVHGQAMALHVRGYRHESSSSREPQQLLQLAKSAVSTASWDTLDLREHRWQDKHKRGQVSLSVSH